MSLFKKPTDDDSTTPVMRTPDMKEKPKMNLERKSGGSTTKEITSIGPGILLTGRLEISSDKHDLHIDGNFKGEIHSNSTVIIGQNGYVEGDIFGSKLIISGRFTGNADFERIELIAGGNVEGTLAAAVLTIDAVSSFHGQSIAKSKGAESPDKQRQPQKPPVETQKAKAIDPVKLTTSQMSTQQGLNINNDDANAVKLTTGKEFKSTSAQGKSR
ncbi:MAG: polymer-forming cytoskeletal protein [Gammaproteobacteria bacterium]|nr:polymer-forming cytoskeletal protein [Gammaproteobacteria bacterium]MCY4218638.1 polymer-forming cytoskeletal protein [Gammaproteobacteria bacterium]MCY4274355.1 polymer-forming cytoskeletal protein [Gammaproteobacteria bacterium]